MRPACSMLSITVRGTSITGAPAAVWTLIVPTGWYCKGDGDVQHTIATDSFVFDSTEATDLEFTDHSAWLVRYFAP